MNDRKTRWPASLHCQVEAAFHSIRAVGCTKAEAPLWVRSIGTWRAYRNESHRFCRFLESRGTRNLLDGGQFADGLNEYLRLTLDRLAEKARSLQTFEAAVSAMGKLELGLNRFAELHIPGHTPICTSELRRQYLRLAAHRLAASSTPYDNRAYPDPFALVEAIQDEGCRLQARVQLESGARCEGVGAPRGVLRNPFTRKNLLGIRQDPVTGESVGAIQTKEKGGKATVHYLTPETFQALEDYLCRFGELSSDYARYIKAINDAAVATCQHASYRGSHGLKHNFAQRRYRECLAHGMTHRQALAQVSRELSHFRLIITLTYTGGH